MVFTHKIDLYSKKKNYLKKVLAHIIEYLIKIVSTHIKLSKKNACNHDIQMIFCSSITKFIFFSSEKIVKYELKRFSRFISIKKFYLEKKQSCSITL